MALSKKKIAILTGPTASGKTAVVMALAQEHDISVISADSRQVFRHCDIGTAKPTKPERERVPHLLIDILDPNEKYSACRFRNDAEEAIKAELKKGRTPVVLGGTGLYIRALLGRLNDIPMVPAEIVESVRAEWAVDDGKQLWEQLKQSDPVAAETTQPTDSQRVMRAISVKTHTGKNLSWFWNQPASEPAYCYCVFGMAVETHVLNERITDRVERMMSDGLPDELRVLLEMGYSWDDPALSSVGYKELRPWIEGRCDLEKVAQDISTATRRYAKRQRTWFRKEPGIDWHDSTHANETILQALKEYIAGTKQ